MVQFISNEFDIGQIGEGQWNTPRRTLTISAAHHLIELFHS